ncbi:MAG: hypothetical protein V1721_03745 [Pseudomonadota bacterium]
MKSFTLALSMLAALSLAACTTGKPVDSAKADTTFSKSLHK